VLINETGEYVYARYRGYAGSLAVNRLAAWLLSRGPGAVDLRQWVQLVRRPYADILKKPAIATRCGSADGENSVGRLRFEARFDPTAAAKAVDPVTG